MRRPQLKFFMGTDNIGRDVFSRLLYAGRISLLIAFIVTIIAETIGALVGAISGFYGGWVDDVIQRTVEFLLTLPLLPLLLAFSALLRGITISGLPQEWSSRGHHCRHPDHLWLDGFLPSDARHGALAAQPGVHRGGACHGPGQLWHHRPPHDPQRPGADHRLGHPQPGRGDHLESALSFLGFGIQPPIPTWGNMLAEYQDDMWTQPAKVFYPGLSIFVVNLAFNYMGDALRDALDPRLKR